MTKDSRLFSHLEWGPKAAEYKTWGGFLRISRRQARNVYDDGAKSAWYPLETAHPPFFDAVVLLLYSRDDAGRSMITLRRCLRPAAALRADEPFFLGLDGKALSGALWELPAGGVETKDLEPGGCGVLGRACLEAKEETGYELTPEDLTPLGAPPFSAPSFCPERLHYFAARVDPAKRGEPIGDGHPMEEGAEVRLVHIDEALDWCRSGRIADLKSEVGLRRFAEWIGSSAG